MLETANLDGEKHPKPRSSIKNIYDALKDKVKIDSNLKIQEWEFDIALKHNIYIAQPNPSLYNFEGYIKEFKDGTERGDPISIGVKNFLFKNAKMVNTKWTLALVLYIGVETKI